MSDFSVKTNIPTREQIELALSRTRQAVALAVRREEPSMLVATEDLAILVGIAHLWVQQ